MKCTRSAVLFLLPLMLAIVSLPTMLIAQDADEAGEDPMAVLHAYAGTWECEGQWAWGATVEARNEYEAVFDGRHMRARTYVSDNGGPEYLRYETLFSYNVHAEAYVYTTIAYDGSVETGTMELREDGFHIESERPNGEGGSVKMRQFMSRVADGRYGWRVQMQNPAGEWVTLIDDQWERQADAEE